MNKSKPCKKTYPSSGKTFTEKDMRRIMKAVFVDAPMNKPIKRCLYLGPGALYRIYKEDGRELFLYEIKQFNIYTSRTGHKIIKDITNGKEPKKPKIKILKLGLYGKTTSIHTKRKRIV